MEPLFFFEFLSKETACRSQLNVLISTARTLMLTMLILKRLTWKECLLNTELIVRYNQSKH